MAEIEEHGECALYQLDNVSLEQPGIPVSQKCGRKIIHYAYDRSIETQVACRAELQLTVEGITEIQIGACPLH